MKRIFYISFLLAWGFLCENVYAQPNFSYTQTCYGSQSTLLASSTLPDASISSWQWDMDGNGTYEMSGKMVIAILIQNDTVPVKLKITPVSGTADSITKNVIIDPLPLVNFIANNLCEAKAAVYISQSSISPGSITQYIWDFNNDGTDDFTGNDTATYTCGPAATYVTKLKCVSNKGCSSFSQRVTTVHANPVAAFTTANTCMGQNTLFTNSTVISNPDYYNWSFGDGLNNLSSGNTAHTYQAAGNYNVQLIAVSQAGCRDTITSSVTINPAPIASLQYSTGDSVLFDGGSVTITVIGGTYMYLWSTGDTLDNITVTQAGTYTVQVTDGNGCPLNLTANIGTSEIPDTIGVAGFIVTPNDDNINDAFIIKDLAAYSHCNLNIYSMWNDEVYAVSGYQNDWKGTNKSGAPVPAGSYYYIIKCDDKPMLKGNINILR